MATSLSPQQIPNQEEPEEVFEETLEEDDSVNSPIKQDTRDALEVEESENSPNIKQEVERAKEQAERVKNAEGKVRRISNPTAQKAVSGAAKNEAAAQAGERAALRAASQATKQAAKASARALGSLSKAAVQLATKNPYVWAAIGIALLIIVLIAIIFSLFALGRGTGKGPAIPPKTAAQRLAATELQALTGNQLANTELVLKAATAAKSRLTQIKPLLSDIYGSSNAVLTKANQDIGALITKLDAVIAEPNTETRKTLISGVTQELTNFNHSYPEVMGYGAVRGAYLPVPGVIEGTAGDCGQASVLMTILYYDANYTDSAYYDPATRKTKDNLSCVTPEYINSKTGTNDWNRFSNAEAGFEAVRKSLAAGDPVVMYTSPNSIYSNTPHIFVIVGYDPSDKSYIINNPYVGGVQLYTKVANGKKMTESHLLQFLGEKHYSHNKTFIMRSRHVQ